MTAQKNPGIRPIQYRIEIEPDFSRSDFMGTTHIQLYSDNTIKEVSFNVLDLAIRRCTCIHKDTPTTCSFHINPAEELLTIFLPAPFDGEINLAIDYYGEINQSMAGFYRSQYTAAGKTHPIAVTQFQESDARRAFPCMDHPRHKASFEVTLTAEPHLSVVSNTPVREQTLTKNGRQRTTFSQTPKMATYLLFFGVGDFAHRPGASDQRVRIVWLPGMAEATDYGLEFGEKALAYCENYFGIPYPLPKLDLIAVPDFAFGAMENWGAITFRENLLLYDPKITSAEVEERICEVIAHEIVHQWFGNLVTPSDWKYLWLNESFATYFGFGVVAHYHPDWQIWADFLASQTAPAMSRDALTDTSAIEIPGGSHVVINSSTAPIIYSKGGSVLRQVEGYLGSEIFQSGLHRYLNNHAYGCATSKDLWMALESVSGQPISDIMRAWVSTPGHPVIIASRSGDFLMLRQKQFTYLPGESDAVWPIPLLIRIFDAAGGSRVIARLMDTPEMTIDIDAEAIAYKINDQQTGFYRVAYDDPHNFDALCRLIRQKALSETDRWGIEADVNALIKARQYSVEQYLRFLAVYNEESSPLVLMSVFSHLHELFLLLDGQRRQKVAGLARQWAAETIDRLGILPGRHDSHGVLRLRSEAVRLAALLDVKDVIIAGMDLFARLISGESLHPDIRRAIMQVGAGSGGRNAYQWLTDQMAAVSSEQDRINILAAMGCFKDTELIQNALYYILHNIPDRNKFIPILQMARNPHAIPLMWDWYANNCKALKKVHPLIHERIIGAVIPICGLSQPDAVRAFFKDNFKETDAAAPVIRMALEKLEINRKLRELYSSA